MHVWENEINTNKLDCFPTKKPWEPKWWHADNCCSNNEVKYFLSIYKPGKIMWTTYRICLKILECTLLMPTIQYQTCIKSGTLANLKQCNLSQLIFAWAWTNLLITLHCKCQNKERLTSQGKLQWQTLQQLCFSTCLNVARLLVPDRRVFLKPLFCWDFPRTYISRVYRGWFGKK